ncbi:MAG: AI-2E family transporter [Deltaproteobacteria bacterium]|nr:AI-2E family transporter [Deltaproteobacteria bacterium]
MTNNSINQRAEQAHLEKRTFLVMLLLLSLLFAVLLQPFWSAIFWACIIGLIFSPLHRRLWQNGKTGANLAALGTLLLCLIICIVPILFVIGSFFQEGFGFYQSLKSGEFDLNSRIEQIQTAFPAIRSFLESLHLDLHNFQTQLSEGALSVTGYLAQHAVGLGQGTMQLLVSLALMLYVAFFMLRDGDKLVDLLIRALPLGNEREHLLFAKFAEVVRATIKGNLLVAIVQGSLGGFIFWAIDVRGALLWGVVMTLLSLIPVVGAGLIWGPVAIYLFAIGAWVQGLVLVAFGALVIGLADNILRPLLVGRDTKLPDYLVLLSTLGGFALFGMNGFVLGPLIAALFIAFWEIFMREFNTPEPAPTAENNPEKAPFGLDKVMPNQY